LTTQNYHYFFELTNTFQEFMWLYSKVIDLGAIQIVAWIFS